VSRRVILFASDATYHVAGDGILAGIIRPNRAQCGMGEGNEYVESLNEVGVNSVWNVVLLKQMFYFLVVKTNIYTYRRCLACRSQ